MAREKSGLAMALRERREGLQVHSGPGKECGFLGKSEAKRKKEKLDALKRQAEDDPPRKARQKSCRARLPG